MKNEITLQTRREFLRRTVLGSALTWTVPAFLADTFSALQAQAADSATQIATGKDATILVVLQMAGGNDGINTVVPYANDFYLKARPRIGLKADVVVQFQNVVGLQTDFRAALVVKIIGVRHDGVDAVVAAGHLQQIGRAHV